MLIRASTENGTYKLVKNGYMTSIQHCKWHLKIGKKKVYDKHSAP
jgi:hypothetical protein